MFTINADFIGNFKLGDNINYNLDILNYSYKRLADPDDEDSHLLRKPIIITIASICEAILHDLHFRMKNYTQEGVMGLSEKFLSIIRLKIIDQFETYIASAKKNKLLGTKSSDIYKNLDELRKLRNRIHIQNQKNEFELDEDKAFNISRQVTAEKTLEELIKIISSNHPRPSHIKSYVNDFVLPWTKHLP